MTSSDARSTAEEERTPLDRFVWVHAQNERDNAVHIRAARRGVWVSFDGVSESSLEAHAGYVLAMRDAGLLGRVLISHDAGWYHVGEPGGGTYRPHDLIFTTLLPQLRTRGLTAADVRQLMVENPRAVLAHA